MNPIHRPQFHYLATSLKLSIITQQPSSKAFRTQFPLVLVGLHAFEDLVPKISVTPVARFSCQRVGEQTQMIKLPLFNKVLSPCGPMELFHIHLAIKPGEVGAQPRKEGLGTQTRCSISEEALLPQWADGQRDAVGGHGSSGSATLL